MGRRLLMMLAVVVVSMAGASVPAVAAPPLEILDFTAGALDAAGGDYTVAGGHPYEGMVSFRFSSGPASEDVEHVRTMVTDLPPGFLGNVAALARCTNTQLATFPDPIGCPASSAVGLVRLEINSTDVGFYALYNMVPERGYPAQFAFNFAGKIVRLFPRLRPRTGEYGVSIISPGVGQIGLMGIEATLFGVPSQRDFGGLVPGAPVGGPPTPFLTNPTDCLVAQPTTYMFVDSWIHPARTLPQGSADFGFPDLSDPLWKPASKASPPVTGCDAPALASQFAPRFDAGPTPALGSSRVDAPTGLTVELDFPQANDPTDTSSLVDPSLPSAPPLKDTVVTLPEGVTISAAGADGLDGCSDLPGPGDQVHYDTTDPVSCPDGSKVGSVVATSPLLAKRDPGTDQVSGADPLEGEVFILKPHPGDLSPSGDQDGRFRLLIEVNEPELGINAKVPGVVTADKVTGRLVGRFENNPQVPVKHLELTFKPGDRAAVANPSTCGTATTSGVFTPWSRGGLRSDGVAVPGTPDATSSSSYPVSWDGNGGACPARLPFGPAVSAGTADLQAGGSSPFAFDLTLEDRHDIITGVQVGLPGGLLGAVKNVPLCSDADANAGTCPASSRVGTATVAAGAGNRPFYLGNQPMSLTGPYKGAPYGLAIAVHATAGPFDLGTVVVRQALHVDPDSVTASVVSDPLPTIRDGVPFRVRRIHAVVDRPGFMRSPTSCEDKEITTNVLSAGGQTANLTTPIRFTGCDKLRFAPKLALKLTGKSQAKVGGHPGLEALVTQQPGESGIKSVTVTLPLSLALDPNNSQSDSLCEYTDGLKNQCPAKSVIGTVTAISPLLKTPVNGKVYFVKGVRTDPKSGRQIRTLPTLLIELRGEINVNLRASNSVPDNQHLTSTFPMVPDAPISSFSMRLNGGKKGILVITDGHDDICYTPQKPFMAAAAHSGKRLDTRTTMSIQCLLAVVSRTFTKTSVKVKISGLAPGRLTISGAGIKTTRATIASATSTTLTAKLTAKGKQLRRAKRDVRIKVSLLAKGTKKTTTAHSKTAKPARK